MGEILCTDDSTFSENCLATRGCGDDIMRDICCWDDSVACISEHCVGFFDSLCEAVCLYEAQKPEVSCCMPSEETIRIALSHPCGIVTSESGEIVHYITDGWDSILATYDTRAPATITSRYDGADVPLFFAKILQELRNA